MITPRLPLYIVEMYASVMYYAPVAASLFSRSMGLNPYAQACLTGLLCHVYYGVYDVNGARNLWWTWHDGDPAISERHCNAPYGSSMWILTYCGIQSFLNSWILRGRGARLTGTVTPSAHDVSASAALQSVTSIAPATLLAKLGRIIGWLRSGAGVLDKLQNWLGGSSDAVQIMYRAAVCTPLFMLAMGQASLFSFDKLGIPGKRTYRFTLVVMIGTVLQQLWAGRNRASAPVLPASYRNANRLFTASVVAHFVLHTMVNRGWFGRPEDHASTGIHQEIKAPPRETKDIMGWPRREDLSPMGPEQYSRDDYGFAPATGAKVDLPEGPIRARPRGPAAAWYTVYGKKHKDKEGEWLQGLRMAVVGVAAFLTCMRKEI